jgi:NADH oxidase (H2O2-forming)
VGIIRPEDYSMIYCAMPYAIEGILPVEKTFKKDELVTGSGAELIRGKVIKVDFGKKEVFLEDGRELRYEKLIIATGAEPFFPPIEGIKLKGVYGFKTEKDMRIILAEVKENGRKKAVVVGAGAIGVELSQALQEAVGECHLVDLAPQVLPAMIDKEYAEPLEKELKDKGIKLYLNNKVEKLEGSERVEKVILSDGSVIELGEDGIIVFCVGVKPQIELFENSDLEIGPQGIIVNDKMETNIPDVYAVGDCVQYWSAITGKIMSGKLATNAVPMARMLCKNMLGEDRSYKGFYNGAATKVGQYYVGGTGLNSANAQKEGFNFITTEMELTHIFSVMPGAKPVKMKILVDKKTRRLIGGQVLGYTPVAEKVDLLTMAVQYELEIDKLASFSYAAQPYQSFFPANHLLVACVEKAIATLKEK